MKFYFKNKQIHNINFNKLPKRVQSDLQNYYPNLEIFIGSSGGHSTKVTFFCFNFTKKEYPDRIGVAPVVRYFKTYEDAKEYVRRLGIEVE